MKTRLLIAFFLLSSASGCSKTDPTQIIVKVDTDLEVMAELDSLIVAAQHRGKTQFSNGYDLGTNTDQLTLPATIALNAGSHATDPVTITVTGKKGAKTVVSRQASLPWVPGRILLLRMDLLRNCAYVVCKGSEMTCVDGACTSSTIDPSTLPKYDEKEALKGLEASVPVADAGSDATADTTTPRDLPGVDAGDLPSTDAIPDISRDAAVEAAAPDAARDLAPPDTSADLSPDSAPDLAIDAPAIDAKVPCPSDKLSVPNNAKFATAYIHATLGNDSTTKPRCTPYRTITFALSKAKSGDQLWLAQGTYDSAHGETFPLEIPSGVELIGSTSTSALTKVVGSGQIGALNLWGTFSFDNVSGVKISGVGLYPGTTTNRYGLFIRDSDVGLNASTLYGYGGAYVATSLKNNACPKLTNSSWYNDEIAVDWKCTGAGGEVRTNNFHVSKIAVLVATGGVTVSANGFYVAGEIGINVSGSATSLLSQNNFAAAAIYSIAAIQCGGTSAPVLRKNFFRATSGTSIRINRSCNADIGRKSAPTLWGNNDFQSDLATAIDHNGTSTINSYGNKWKTTPTCGGQIKITGTTRGTVVGDSWNCQ